MDDVTAMIEQAKKAHLDLQAAEEQRRRQRLLSMTRSKLADAGVNLDRLSYEVNDGKVILVVPGHEVIIASWYNECLLFKVILKRRSPVFTATFGEALIAAELPREKEWLAPSRRWWQFWK
jgi:hypothetical protein